MINQMVISKEIEWIGYEQKKNMMQVEFIAGSVYHYEQVPQEIFHAFLEAPSHGRFFDSQVKGRYAYRKIK